MRLETHRGVLKENMNATCITILMLISPIQSFGHVHQQGGSICAYGISRWLSLRRKTNVDHQKGWCWTQGAAPVCDRSDLTWTMSTVALSSARVERQVKIPAWQDTPSYWTLGRLEEELTRCASLRRERRPTVLQVLYSLPVILGVLAHPLD